MKNLILIGLLSTSVLSYAKEPVVEKNLPISSEAFCNEQKHMYITMNKWRASGVTKEAAHQKMSKIFKERYLHTKYSHTEGEFQESVEFAYDPETMATPGDSDSIEEIAAEALHTVCTINHRSR